jgi:hypothetical protein
MHGSPSGLTQNEEGNMVKLTWQSSAALAAPLWLAAAAGFVLLLGLAYNFSNGPLATKRLPVGAAASP